MWTTRVAEEEPEKLYLLHTFGTLHTKAITGLAMHPSPGLAISASLDGYIKLINLEAFSELLAIKTDSPVTSLRCIVHLGVPSCLFTQISGRIRVWRITYFLQYFGLSTSNILTLRREYNLQVNSEARFEE